MAYASFAEQYLRASIPPPIEPDQVRRIALEGGGGKGNAFLGALYALDDLKVLGQLETVSGSSAGAITAMALSLGMTPPETYQFIATTDFFTFFDDPGDGRPTVGAPYERAGVTEKAERAAITFGMRASLNTPSTLSLAYTAAKGAYSAARRSLLETILSARFRLEDISYGINALYLGPGAGAPPRRPSVSDAPQTLQQKLLAKFLGSAPDYLTSLSWDMGVFSGEVARDTLAGLIGRRFAPGSSEENAKVVGRTVTFAQLDAYCQARKLPKLRVTGSEMCSTKSVIFSGETTGKFPVADAVRISMGLPVVYKPYTIRRTGEGFPPCGVYVDGGLFANLPLNAFTDAEAATAIGLRLEVDRPKAIEGFLGFLLTTLAQSVLSGESVLATDRSQRTIRLDTLPLETIGFEVPKTILDSVTARSHLTTLAFFGRADRYRPVDVATGAPLQGQKADAAVKATWDDIERSIRCRQEAAGCVFPARKPPRDCLPPDG